jgi:hypothetical protein
MKRLPEPYHRFTQDFSPASELGTHRKEGTDKPEKENTEPCGHPECPKSQVINVYPNDQICEKEKDT